MFDFKQQIKQLPDKPGVYLMKNSLGEIIYVGKAKILKNRVKQYFQSSKNHSEKVKAMVKNISEFEYIVTDSEIEALILECNLIKKFRPRYNILLKDDKGYPYIKITINEDFPRIFVTRRYIKDGSKYFGPYTDVSAVYETMDLIKSIFPIRNCKKHIKFGDKKNRPCLNYHIGLCLAPCSGMISNENYTKMINQVIDVLSGKDKSLIHNLKEDMKKASDELEFEKAASLRDKLLAVEKLMEKQKITLGNQADEDFIGIYRDEKDSCVQVFFVRDGKIIGREHFIIENTEDEKDEDILNNFVKRFYGGTAFIPKTIYIENISEGELLEQWLSHKKEHKVSIKVPVRGEKKKILNMVNNNAKITLQNFKLKIIKEKQNNENILIKLAELLQLEDLPNRIESYDISNIAGFDSVGSMVVFENGKAKNSDYRRFMIKEVEGANDYASMKEILNRRFKRGLEEIKAVQDRNLHYSKGKFSVFPDLIMMDGGKIQVNAAMEVLNGLDINIPVCGMVKDDNHNTRGLIYNNKEILIKSNDSLMHFITRVQDEVHRFAITYHRSLRDKRSLHSVLEDIPNVGPKRRKELLIKFGSVENIKKATIEEILEVKGMNRISAESVINYFRGKKELMK